MTQTPRDWQKDMEMCEAAPKGPWIIHPKYQDLVNDKSEVLIQEVRWGPVGHLISEARTALPYWLQEAKMMRDTIEMAMNEYHLWQSGDTAAPMMYGILQEAMSTLYPDTPAPKEGK